MSRYFIERPIFAMVIGIVIMMAGILAILALPISQYPTIAPPEVGIQAFYPGADAATVQASVTQVIEQQLKGLDHLMYFSSTSEANGGSGIDATFAPGTNPDIAQVQVQNRLAQAAPVLPSEVQQEGLSVYKSGASFLMIVAVYDTSGRYSDIDIADYLNSRLVDPLARVHGVGNVNVFGGQYAMRIWLDPYKLNNFKLMPADVRNALLAQNIQVPAGEIGGQPTVPGQALNATITAQSQLRTAEQFKDIILKTQPDGSQVRLSQVARVELGADNYSVVSRINGRPAGGRRQRPGYGRGGQETGDRAGGELSSRHSAHLPSRHHHLHQALDPAGGHHPHRGDRPGDRGDVPLPAELARDPDPGGGCAGGAAGNLRGPGDGRLHHQYADHVRHGSGHRPARRRRHRRGRKRRADHERRGPLAQGRDHQVDG
jgi:hypothetical protein